MVTDEIGTQRYYCDCSIRNIIVTSRKYWNDMQNNIYCWAREPKALFWFLIQPKVKLFHLHKIIPLFSDINIDKYPQQNDLGENWSLLQFSGRRWAKNLFKHQAALVENAFYLFQQQQNFLQSNRILEDVSPFILCMFEL